MDAFLHEGMEDDGTLLSEVESTISEARADLKSMQSEDGHWVFDLEADATIPAEFIFSITTSTKLTRRLRRSSRSIFEKFKVIMAVGACFTTGISTSAQA